MNHLNKLFRAIGRFFQKLSDKLYLARLRFHIRELNLVNDRFNVTLANAINKDDRTADEFVPICVSAISKSIEDAEKSFASMSRNKKVAVNFAQALKQDYHYTLETQSSNLNRLLDEEKSKYNRQLIDTEVDKHQVALKQANIDLEYYFEDNGIIKRDPELKDVGERIIAWTTIIFFFLLEVGINSWALRYASPSGALGAMVPVATISLINTAIPFALAIYIFAKKGVGRSSIFINRLVIPMMISMYIVLWLIANGALVRMKNFSEYLLATGAEYQITDISNKALEFPIDFLDSFSLIQIFVIGFIAAVVSFNHGKDWRDPDPTVYRYGKRINRIKGTVKNIIDDADDKLSDIDVDFDAQIIDNKQTVINRRDFVQRVRLQLALETEHYNRHKQSLRESIQNDLIQRIATLWGVRHGPLSEDHKNAIKDQALHRLETAFDGLLESFNIDIKEHVMISNNEMADLSATLMDEMNKYKETETTHLNNRKIEFFGI